MSILKKNLLYLNKNNPRLTRLLHLPNMDFYPCMTAKITSTKIPIIEDKFVHSIIDPINEGKITAQNFIKELKGHDVVVLGMGLGFHVQELLNAENVKNIFIVEKDIRLFKTILGLVEIEEILSKTNFYLDVNASDVIEDIKKVSDNFVVFDFYPVTRFQSEYFSDLKEKLSSAWKAGQETTLYLESLLQNKNFFEAIKVIREKKEFNQNDFILMMMHEIYMKNRKSDEAFSN